MSGENTKVYMVQGGDELVVSSGGKITVLSGGTIVADGGSTVTGFGGITPAAAIVDLTASGAGTANDAISAMSNLSDSPATADALRDELNAVWKPIFDNNFADLQVKMNAILAALRTAGVIET